jgi:hypothetical protein
MALGESRSGAWRRRVNPIVLGFRHPKIREYTAFAVV